MQAIEFVCRAAKPLAPAVLAALLAGPMSPLPTRAETVGVPCDSPIDLLRLASPLPRFAGKLAAGKPITIVAIGSSSTAGAGASSSAATYPSRLAAELKRHFPKNEIAMINRGIGGEEIPDMLKRFDKAVVANQPDLVLWQLGTNALIRGHQITDRGAAIRNGLKKIRSIGADIVLIDPQFAPKVNVKPDAEQMVAFISTVAQQEDVALFHRYGVMKRWREIDKLPFKIFVAPDGLHMNDWSYACMAKGLGLAIAEAVRRPVVEAKVMPRLDEDE